MNFVGEDTSRKADWKEICLMRYGLLGRLFVAALACLTASGGMTGCDKGVNVIYKSLAGWGTEPAGDAHVLGVPKLDSGESSSEKGRNLRLTEVAIGTKNYLQINATFSALTGVPSNNEKVLAKFEEVKGGLPSNNDIKLVSASVQNAINQLAAEYCREMINDQSLRVARLPNFNIDEDVSTALDAEGTGQLVSDLIQSFWRGFSASQDESAIDIMNEIVDEIKVGIDASNAGTQAIAVGMCTVTLSSPIVITI
jgi:hypothetical protein